MKNILIVMTSTEDNEPKIVNVHEIKSIDCNGEGSLVSTTSGILYALESPAELYDQYQGRLEPIIDGSYFFRTGELCETCAAKNAGQAETAVSPNLKQLTDGLSVRANNLIQAAYPPSWNLQEDRRNWSQVSLTPILAITEEQWAGMRNSSPEVAQQISQRIRDLMNPESAVSPNIQQLFDKLSVAAAGVVKAVIAGEEYADGSGYFIGHRDWSREPLEQLVGHTAEGLARVQGSSPEIAKQILHWTYELMGMKEPEFNAERN